jgi:hypothetical protein
MDEAKKMIENMGYKVGLIVHLFSEILNEISDKF